MYLTSKQRATLKSVAGKCEVLFQIGKGGINDNLVKAASDALNARELIKLSVLKSCPLSPSEALSELAGKLSAQPVCAIGSRIVMYRYSENVAEHIRL